MTTNSSRNEIKFWERASTVIACLREGHAHYPRLMETLRLPRTTLFYLLRQMEQRGIVTRTPDTTGTLRLTEEWQNTGDLIRLAQRNGRGSVPYKPTN